MNNIHKDPGKPPFVQGQKIVAKEDSVNGKFSKGTVYTVNNCDWSRASMSWTLIYATNNGFFFRALSHHFEAYPVIKPTRWPAWL